MSGADAMSCLLMSFLRGSEVLHAQEHGEEKQDIRLLPVLTP